eukprot:s3643_g1.t1
MTACQRCGRRDFNERAPAVVQLRERERETGLVYCDLHQAVRSHVQEILHSGLQGRSEERAFGLKSAPCDPVFSALNTARIRGKETRALCKALAASAGEAVAEAILPAKVDIAGGGSSLQFIFAGDECVLVQLDGKADLGQGELMPTLVSLWKVPSAESWLPCAIIQ